MASAVRRLTPSPGVSMPAVTTRLDSTKHDMRNGSITGSPVSAMVSRYLSSTLSAQLTRMQRRVDNLLGLPQLRRHLLGLALLVGYYGLLGLLEPGPANKERPSKQSVSSLLDTTDSHLLSTHRGSVMPAVCFTRPQYVLRSYWDTGRSRPPGSEADMVTGPSRVRRGCRKTAFFVSLGGSAARQSRFVLHPIGRCLVLWLLSTLFLSRFI